MIPRDKLKNLEIQGGCLFHGTGVIIEKFEPRQSHTIINSVPILDGEPAIFASPFTEYAIFMALVNEENCPLGYRSGCAYENGILQFTATKETLEQLTDESKGYVYVFDKAKFTERSASEWVSHGELMPLTVVEVTRSDFATEIKEI